MLIDSIIVVRDDEGVRYGRGSSRKGEEVELHIQCERDDDLERELI